MGITKNCSTLNLPEMKYKQSGGDTLDVAISYGPLSYYLYDDTLGGLNYDILRYFQNQTSSPLKLIPVSNIDKALSQLEQNKIDLVAALPADYNLKKRFLTSESIYLDRLVLLQNLEREKKINSVLDLGEDTVMVSKGSPALARLLNLRDETGIDIPIKEMEDLSEELLCLNVVINKNHLVVVNEKIAKKMQAEYPILSFENPISFTQFQVWLFNKNDTLLMKKIDNWFNEFKFTEEYKDLLRRY